MGCAMLCCDVPALIGSRGGGGVLSLTAHLEYGLGGACMPRQGEFSGSGAHAAHAIVVLRPLFGSALMLAALVRAILYYFWMCGP